MNDNYNWDLLFKDWDLTYENRQPYSNDYILTKGKQRIKIDTYSHSLRSVEGEYLWLTKMSKQTFYSLCVYVQKRFMSAEENEVEARLKELGVAVESI